MMLRIISVCVLSALCLTVDAKTSSKAKASKTSSKKAAAPVAAIPQSAHRIDPYVGAISADAAPGGKVFFSDHATREAYPASCTKLMTALLVLEDIRAGKYQLTDRVTASVRATYEEPSGVGIKPGQSMTVDDLLMALMVRSANDAAVMLAEHANNGDLMGFLVRMNAKAKALGMAATHYDSPNGLPPYDSKRRPKKWRTGYDKSTAADLLTLAREVVKYPEIFKYTSQKIATVTDGAGQPLKSVNHNNVMVKDKLKVHNPDGTEACDGLKTGYIDAGGSSVVLTGKRGGKRAIVVVTGSASSKLRDTHAKKLMEQALDKLSE